MHLLSALFALSAIFSPCEASTGLGVGMRVHLRASNDPSFFLRHSGFNIFVEQPPQGNQGLFFADSTWVVVPGLSGYGISFRSENYPDHFLRHSAFECYLSMFEDNDQFKFDASWTVNDPLAPSANDTENRVSLRSANFPGQFMRHQFLRVRIDQQAFDDVYRHDATWIVETLDSPSLTDTWRLLWSYNNLNSPNSFNKTWTTEYGITETRSATAGGSWLASVTASASYSYFGFSASIEATVEVQEFYSQTSVSEYSAKRTETTSIEILPGTAAFMWQYTLTAGNPNTFSMTNSFQAQALTESNIPPTGPPCGSNQCTQ